jgi:hypothetical protein
MIVARLVWTEHTCEHVEYRYRGLWISRCNSMSSGSLENSLHAMFSHPNVVLKVFPSPPMNYRYQTLNTEESCKAHTSTNFCDQPISSRKCVGSKCKHPTSSSLFFVSHVSRNLGILQKIDVPTPTVLLHPKLAYRPFSSEPLEML